MKLRITVEGVSYEVEVEVLDNGSTGSVPSLLDTTATSTRPAQSASPVASPRAASPASVTDTSKVVRSPIAGVILQVKVKPGDTVALNQIVFVLEAMKMETNVASPLEGKVKSIHVNTGEAVKQGQLLIEYA